MSGISDLAGPDGGGLPHHADPCIVVSEMRKRIEFQVSRRQFLGGAALAGQILSPAAAASGTGRIIDTHIHLYDPNRPQGTPCPQKHDKLLSRRTMRGA